jgi:hypothetical protein
MNVPSTAPADSIGLAEVITVLREAAATAPEGTVRLLLGLTDEAMDSWNVPVPEDIRTILREVGGLRIGGDNEAAPDPATIPRDREDFTPDHQFNGTQYADVCGEEGTYRVVHDNASGATYYVDIHPDTGTWGRVFMWQRDGDADLLAETFPGWLLELARYVRNAASNLQSGYFDSFSDAYWAWFFAEFEVDPCPPGADAEEQARNATVIQTAEAMDLRESSDPELAGLARTLPDDAEVADLRHITAPARVTFDSVPVCHQRLLHGRILCATSSFLSEDDDED